MQQQIMNNMEVTWSLLIIKWEEFSASIDLIGLITSADFNRLSINLKLVIIDFRISADSQPYCRPSMCTLCRRCHHHTIYCILYANRSYSYTEYRTLVLCCQMWYSPRRLRLYHILRHKLRSFNLYIGPISILYIYYIHVV